MTLPMPMMFIKSPQCYNIKPKTTTILTTTAINCLLRPLLLITCFIAVTGGELSKTILYQAPDECTWSGNSESDITLNCHLRTINSELENTNFSVIQPRNTIRLRLECNDALFFQSSLSPDSFRALIELRSLTIEYCKLGNVTEGSFRGLQDLRNLTIRTHNGDWSTMSLVIAPHSFSELRQLNWLDLSLNNIWAIPDDMICPLKLLQHLNISHNEIQNIESLHLSAVRKTSHICGGSLLTLDLSANKIANLPTAVLSALHRLTHLNLARNGMHFIADRALEGLNSLTVVDLSQNSLTSLPPELFLETKHLKEIHLKNNSINVLAPGVFSNLAELLVLDISHNELNSQWVNAATFVGLKQLILLDLSANKVSKLDANIFRSLLGLQILKLEENFIDHVPNGTFAGLSNLHTLILSNNRISIIGADSFRGLSALQVLSLDYNRISKIDAQAFKHCVSLQDLHLNNNKLQHVPDALSQVPLLKTLDMGENLLMHIENTSVTRMENLYGLRLTENLIENVRVGTFNRITSLRILNLSRNKIKLIEAGCFQHNQQLQAIRLDGNKLKNIVGVFNELPNLVWLNISDNRLEKFDYSFIPISLQWLDVRSNRISQLGNYFEVENELKLTTFDASFNHLTEITAGSIPNSVEIMYLNDNLIYKIQPYTFFKKPNLTKVDLTHNKLTTLEPNALRLSPTPEDKLVPDFYIGHNPFHCDCSLDWLPKFNADSRTQPKINDLDRIYCKISYGRSMTHVPLIEAKPNDFLCKYESHCFALCHCCEFQACDCKMECPERCACYHDQSWTANVVDCSHSGYERDLPLHIPMDSTQLYLDGNNFIELSSHAFIGRKRLKILHLNHSHIEKVHNRTFYGLLELEILQLNHNNLHALNGYEFQGLDNLQELYLQHNSIRTIDALTFTRLYHLKVLRLDHNLLVNFAVWNYLPSYLNELRLADNPWTCHCDFLDKLREYISTHRAVYDKLKVHCYALAGTNGTVSPNSAQQLQQQQQQQQAYEQFVVYLSEENIENVSVVCNGNGRLHIHKQMTKRPLDASANDVIINGNMTSTKMILSKPPMNDYMPILIAILVSVMLVIIFTFMAFIFRQEMRVWCHSRFGIRVFCNANKDADKNEREKLFDAFISYSSKDEAFVSEEIAPALEQGDVRYKLCLHHRDFPVRSYGPDNIVHAIDTSRRTIIVLSENFIKLEWSRFEFKSAYHSVLRDRRRRLIVIVLGEVPQKDLDPDLRLYLKTNTFLQWGDKLFWEKLRFALPDVPNNQRRPNNFGGLHCNGGVVGGGGAVGAHMAMAVAPHMHHAHHHHHIHLPPPPPNHIQQLQLQQQHLQQQQQQQQQQQHQQHIHMHALTQQQQQQQHHAHMQRSSFRAPLHNNVGGGSMRHNHNRNNDNNQQQQQAAVLMGAAMMLTPSTPNAAPPPFQNLLQPIKQSSGGGGGGGVGGGISNSNNNNSNNNNGSSSIQHQCLPLPPCPSPIQNARNTNAAQPAATTTTTTATASLDNNSASASASASAATTQSTATGETTNSGRSIAVHI